MEDDDRPRSRTDAANALAGEALDSYSREELEARIQLLETEIARVRVHREKVAAHMSAADQLFRPRSS